MIQTGKSITSKDDLLQKVKVEYLYHKLVNPESSISALISQLRIVRQIDSRQYSMLKRSLPYVVCGAFNPPVRRTENFAFTEYFIVDIDKITEKEMSIEALRDQLQRDTRVMMCFLSPGEDGLKLLFRLKERCYDPGIYSLFYRLFVKQFSAHYQLEQVVDSHTCDVTRACFISVDPDAYYNPEADPVNLAAYIDEDNTSDLFRMKKELDKENSDKGVLKEIVVSGVSDDEALMKIKSILSHNKKQPVEKKDAYVPEQLNVLMDKLIPYIRETGITVEEPININYGKKIKMRLNLKEAEINLFYGKRGYSVVLSPRKGTNEELNMVCAELINQFLAH